METPKHVVAIVGGAISGSVAAEILADKGVAVVVIEQNARPYGKIEDGLPRWHSKQRKLEYARIDARLARPNVHFVPLTRLGRDVAFIDLARDWGLSALLLANGAWRDRPLDVPGLEGLEGKGLVYQNAFIQWFNHANEARYEGPRCEVPDDGVLVVGGGLASIDVIKVVQIELYRRALAKRSFNATVNEIERDGVAATCARFGVADPASLGVRDGILIYRRRAEDMPLAQNEAARLKILEKVREKFRFEFEDRRLSKGAIVEGGRLRGLVLAETKVDGRKADAIPGSEREVRVGLVVSSIGSVPEKIPGIEMRGEIYAYKNVDTGEYAPIPGVFGIGNVVTGQGNIRVSSIHGQVVARRVAENYLGIGESRDLGSFADHATERGTAGASAVADHLESRGPLAPGKAQELLERAKALQTRVGYLGDYHQWIQAHTPPDLE